MKCPKKETKKSKKIEQTKSSIYNILVIDSIDSIFDQLCVEGKEIWLIPDKVSKDFMFFRSEEYNRNEIDLEVSVFIKNDELRSSFISDCEEPYLELDDTPNISDFLNVCFVKFNEKGEIDYYFLILEKP